MFIHAYSCADAERDVGRRCDWGPHTRCDCHMPSFLSFENVQSWNFFSVVAVKWTIFVTSFFLLFSRWAPVLIGHMGSRCLRAKWLNEGGWNASCVGVRRNVGKHCHCRLLLYVSMRWIATVSKAGCAYCGKKGKWMVKDSSAAAFDFNNKCATNLATLMIEARFTALLLF